MEICLRTIQVTELECLKEIKRVCTKKQLTYCLAYGSMLGAVRHKGFIPWDDDLDIYMYYRDAQSIGKYINQDEFFLQTPKTDPKSPFVYYKLRKNHTEMIEEQYRNLDIHHGVWVDIFLCYDAANSEPGRKLQHKLSEIQQAIRVRWYDKSIQKKDSVAFIVTHMPGFVAVASEKIMQLLIRLLGSKKSSYLFVPCNETFEHSFLDRCFWNNMSEYEFEHEYFTGVANYDEYLKWQYGDNYMTPIRYGSHTDFENVSIE